MHILSDSGKVKASISEGNSIKLYLTSEFESVFKSRSLNHEFFTFPAVLVIEDVCLLLNTPAHHTIVNHSDFLRQTVWPPSSFMYAPFQNMWFNFANSDSSSLTVGSCRVYKDMCVNQKTMNNVIKIDLLSKSTLNDVDTQCILKCILNGASFKLYCILKNGNQALFDINLPMINEAGEYLFHITPIQSFSWVFQESSESILRLFERLKQSWGGHKCQLNWDDPYCALRKLYQSQEVCPKPIVSFNISDVFHDRHLESLHYGIHCLHLCPNSETLNTSFLPFMGKPGCSSYELKTCHLIAQY